jgi:DNA modification methylase
MRPKKINIRKEMEMVVPSRWYATHHFDRYPAKMIPQLARFAIERCTNEGDTVLDPFCGCGTSLVESRIAGRRATGIEINPYAVILAHAKSHLYRESLLKDLIEATIEKARSIHPRVKKSWLNYWFGERTLCQLRALHKAIISLEDDMEPSYAMAMKAILAVIVRLVSRADPRSPKPFISRTARKKRSHDNFDAFQTFVQQGNKFVKASKEFKSLVKHGPSSRVRIVNDDARELSKRYRLGCFDAIVSSPPYLSAQDYYRSSKLEISVLKLIDASELECLGPSLIGSGRGKICYEDLNNMPFIPPMFKRLMSEDKRSAATVASFLCDIAEVMKGCYERLKSNGKCCLIIGDSIIRGIKLPTHQWIIELAIENNFTLQDHFVDAIKSCRIPPQRVGHESVIDKEHILVFIKS